MKCFKFFLVGFVFLTSYNSSFSIDAACPFLDEGLWSCGPISPLQTQELYLRENWVDNMDFSLCPLSVSWQEQICTYDGEVLIKIFGLSFTFPSNDPNCNELKYYIKVGAEYRQDRLREIMAYTLESLAVKRAIAYGIRDCLQYPSTHVYSSWASCGYYVGYGRDENGDPLSWEFHQCGGESHCCYFGSFCLDKGKPSPYAGWRKSDDNSFCSDYLPPLPIGATGVTRCGHICDDESDEIK